MAAQVLRLSTAATRRTSRAHVIIKEPTIEVDISSGTSTCGEKAASPEAIPDDGGADTSAAGATRPGRAEANSANASDDATRNRERHERMK